MGFEMVALGLIFNGIAWLYQLLLGLATWENRRYARSRIHRSVPGVLPWQRIALIVPCKGNERGLAENLACFLRQDHPNYSVTFVVESTADPAYEVIQHLLSHDHTSVTNIRGKTTRAKVVVAGYGIETGQKIHNLQAAIRSQLDDVNVLAFADSDIRPDVDWLRALVFGLSREGVGAVSGYRWFHPERNTMANLLLYSFNSAAAALYGPGGHFLVWGGSWAIRRDYFDELAIDAAWDGTLSDDLVASRTLKLAKLKVAFEPRAMVASHVDLSLPNLGEFVRRQFLIGRRYATRMWLLSWISLTVFVVAFWGSLAVFAGKLLAGQGVAWWLAANAIGLYSLGVFRAWLRQDLSHIYFPLKQDALSSARRFDTWLSPFASLFLWVGYIASCVGNSIVWRGIGYFIAAGGRVQLLGRRLTIDPAAAASCRAAESETNSETRKFKIRRAA